MATIVVRYPDGRELGRVLDRDVLAFGKADGNDLVLNARGVSREHGRFLRDCDGRWWIEDRDSSNGTIVQGRLIKKRCLEDGDVIVVGQVQIVFAADQPELPFGRGSAISFSDAPETPGSTVARQASDLMVRDSARLSALYEFARRLMGRHDVSGLVDEASATLISALHAQRVVFGLTCDPEHESDRVLVRPAGAAAAEVMISRSVLRRTIAGQQAVLIADTSADLDARQYESVIAGGIRSVLCVPMVRDDEVIGFIYTDNRLHGRAYIESDLEFACAIGAMVATAVENARLIEAKMVKQRLEAELAGARRVQQAILPSVWPRLDGWDIYGAHFTCREVGGDYYDAIVAEDGHLWLLMADVSGKGAPAALLASRMHAMTQGLLERCDSPGQLLTSLNDLLLRRSLEGLFVTCQVVRLSPDTGDGLIASAGHPYPMYIGSGGDARSWCVDNGCPLGILHGTVYGETSCTFPTGEGAILLYTDGATEAFGGNLEQFGEERLLAAAASCAGYTARKVVENVRREVETFCAGRPPSDDFTLLACRRVAAGGK
ncbi:MAG TPA: SpoIIE family protein phosphatase [Phycisphaerae bacterium]|nr:SpoIIE family protein phosphatase [Phycisphaerae bacterium]